jgi:hypothetical protein
MASPAGVARRYSSCLLTFEVKLAAMYSVCSTVHCAADTVLQWLLYRTICGSLVRPLGQCQICLKR